MYTYICIMNLEQALKMTNFKSEVHKASLNILYTAWVIKTETSTGLKQFGLTHEQYNVLRILKGSHPGSMCVKEIGNRMIERNSNVPRIIDRLVVKKLVKRTNSPLDKRETVINITTAGTVLLEASTFLLEQIWNKLFAIQESEAGQLNRLIEKMRRKMN